MLETNLENEQARVSYRRLGGCEGSVRHEDLPNGAIVNLLDVTWNHTASESSE